MPFPINVGCTPGEFRLLINGYWPDLSNKIVANNFVSATDKARLVDDYCAIGAFLANPAAVERCLIPLETTIRQGIAQLGNVYQQQFPKTQNAAIQVTKRADSGGAASLKSHKLLSGALRESEAMGGFNHEGIQNGTFFAQAVLTATLHSEASVSDRAGTLTPAGRNAAAKVPLPSGVPTVHGSLDGKAFNGILLRHGYQFKDVAAGAYHGEYTHRLQWYAIMRAQADHTITLINTPLEIFKSLGYLYAKATANIPDGRHLYLWEMLFDCAKNEVDADDISGTLAWCSKTYNSPENMNMTLMNFVNRSDTVNDLWCLRVLLKTRWKKRFDATTQEPAPPDKASLALQNNKVQRMYSGDVPATPARPGRDPVAPVRDALTRDVVTQGVPGRKPTLEAPGKVANTLVDASYMLAWYLANPKVP